MTDDDNPVAIDQAQTAEPANDNPQIAAERPIAAPGSSDPALSGRTRKRPGGHPPFAPGNPGRPKGVVVGKAKLAQLRRDKAIADALGEQTPTAERGIAYFEAILRDPKASQERKDFAAAKLVPVEKGQQTDSIERIPWARLSPEQRRQGQDALRLLIDLRHIAYGRKPEFGLVG